MDKRDGEKAECLRSNVMHYLAQKFTIESEKKAKAINQF